MKSMKDAHRYFCGKFLFLPIFLLHLLAPGIGAAHPLHTCENLCRLCTGGESDGGLCRSSLEFLTKKCISGQHSVCDFPRRQECSPHLAVAEQFLLSANGFWCQRSRPQSSALSVVDSDDELVGNCVFLLQSYDFVRLSNELTCRQAAPLVKPARIQLVGNAPILPSEFPPQRRTTRTPDRIQRWKNELSSDLASFARVLPATSCNSALHDLCLRHISCRELWKIFRQSCVVDAQNQCKMTNRNDCWQSFEGISWTGLGTCACLDNNSDCQFIRLQTNYNKCIYEIKNSGNIPHAESPQDFHSRHFSTPVPPYFLPTTPSSGFENSAPASLVAPFFPPGRTAAAMKEAEELRQRTLEEQKRQQQTLADAQRKQQEMLSLYEQQIRQREMHLHEQQQKLNEKQREIQMRQEAQNRQAPPIPHYGIQSPASTDDYHTRSSNGVKSGYLSQSENRHQQWKPTVHKWRERYRPAPSMPFEQHKHRRPTANAESSISRGMPQDSLDNGVTAFEQQHKLRRPSANVENFSHNDWGTPTPSSSLMTSDVAPPTSHPPLFRDRMSTTTSSSPPPPSPPLTTVSMSDFVGRSVGNLTTAVNATKNFKIIPKFALKARARFVHKSAIVDNDGRVDILNEERNDTAVHDIDMFTTTIVSTTEALDEVESQLVIPPTNSTIITTTTETPSTTTTTTTSSSTTTTTTEETTTSTSSTTVGPTSSETTSGESAPTPTSTLAAPRSKLKKVRKFGGTKRPPLIADEKRKYKAQLILSKKSPFTESSTNVEESTCQAAYRRCEEESETCRWHLSELQIKCPSDNRRCSRDQCAKAVGRFSRYVPRPMVESLMFCQCAFSDGECKHLQQWMYPRCLYSFLRNKPRYSCTQAVKICQSDALCWRQLKIYNSSCSVTTNFSKSSEKSSQPSSKTRRLRAREIEGAGAENLAAENVTAEGENEDESFAECTADRMDSCRSAVIGVRGSFLEAPCYCEETDAECLEKQMMILPNNPCIEAAMIDYTVKHFTSSERRLKSRVIDGKMESSPPPVDDFFSFGMTDVTVLPPLSSREMEVDDVNSIKEKYEMVGTDNAEAVDPNATESGEAESETAAGRELMDVLEIDFNDTISSDDNLTSVASTLIATQSSLITTKTALLKAIRSTKSPLVAEKKARKLHRGMNLPTGAYVTQRPPPAGGCATRNIDGEWNVHYKDSVFRQYEDWSGRCSSWCECSRSEKLKCHELGCLVDMHCEALHTTVGYGERLYLEGRGACQCQSGKFICDTSEDYPELEPGLYISLGYSKDELALLKEKVPKAQLEKSGLVSPSSSVTKDIATRLQFALERVLPKGTLCRIAVFEHFAQESVIMFQVQYYGINHFANETKPKWHVGKLEKTCASFARELEHNFLLEKADRYQLILSTIKQLRVIDLLDEIPPTTSPLAAAAALRPSTAQFIHIFLLLHSPLILRSFDAVAHSLVGFVVPFLRRFFVVVL